MFYCAKIKEQVYITLLINYVAFHSESEKSFGKDDVLHLFSYIFIQPITYMFNVSVIISLHFIR